MTDLSQELGISVASLREQLEVARTFGLVEVRPKTGIRKLPYTFTPAVANSLAYAVRTDQNFFRSFSDFRNHIETAYWYQAVALLTPEDVEKLQGLVKSAFAKLHGLRAQIPHSEHRELHLMIFRRLNNPFVMGILEAYWEIYEAVGLDVYTDLVYLERVWSYHQRMVDSISSGNFAAGYQALTEHTDLIFQRSRPSSIQNRQKFE
ncbi:FadR/GntR family transcriptional regulator [Longilinea arvoryzae]|uniref:FadR/GntR family transcriptional regulator n=1 Tax=Longilinea arvoryzae TaxID=360412 RepID=UPI001560B0E6|nr:FCD domain-containing protein [Longilinea arvoryzae]